MLSSDFHCKEDDGTIGAAYLIQNFFSDVSGYQESKEPGEPQESGFSPKSLNQVHSSGYSVIFLTMKI